jgi:hypothetical protein
LQLNAKYDSQLLPALHAILSKQLIGDILYSCSSQLYSLYGEYYANFDISNMFLKHIDKSTKTPFLKNDGKSVKFHATKSSLKKLENFLRKALTHPQHSQLNFQGYLILPVQRLPRYKLLLTEVLRSTPVLHPDFESCKLALASIEKQISKCNEHKRQQQAYQEGMSLLSKMYFSNYQQKRVIEKLLEKGEELLKAYPVQINKMVEWSEHAKFPLIDTMLPHLTSKKCDRQHDFCLDLTMTYFAGEQFYFLLFEHFLVWCKKSSDLQGKRELLCILPTLSEETDISKTQIRLVTSFCILYFSPA